MFLDRFFNFGADVGLSFSEPGVGVKAFISVNFLGLGAGVWSRHMCTFFRSWFRYRRGIGEGVVLLAFASIFDSSIVKFSTVTI